MKNLQIHCCPIKVSTKKVSYFIGQYPETKAYQSIPMIADFTNENGSDSLRETIEANYREVKQEVLFLVDSETARIKADPALQHLIK